MWIFGIRLLKNLKLLSGTKKKSNMTSLSRKANLLKGVFVFKEG